MPAKMILGGDRVDAQVDSVLISVEKGHVLELILALPTTDQHWIMIQLERHLGGILA